MRHFQQRAKVVSFTRSYPRNKNDNARIEQKSWTFVRHLFGYDRFSNPWLVDLMNDFYSQEWSHYQKHFCPTLKLKEKLRINNKCRKQYEAPKTSNQRLMECNSLSDQQNPP